MMKNKTTKVIVNGVVLAALAALGVTVYQLGTAPVKEDNTQDEIRMESVQQEAAPKTEEEPMVDVGTNHVEANLDNEASDGTDVDLTANAGTQTEEEANAAVDPEEVADASASVLTGPEINFSEDTSMEWPVNGNILLDYSMDQTTYFPTLDQYKLNPAIAVQAVEGAPVMAAVNGTVFSIEENAQTGTTVTMELGNGYQAVYGQLKDLSVAEGDTVKEGTIIGYISAPTKYYSLEGSNLYFAMKKDGEPIDPIAYLP
ncbi:MAG: peptidoglycan DD-metalloendopeptidase family protein [Eubacteriales bacterium]|nr:peptidoglycan DD-metalloendopeptidase family protein [Eubacteriales bacterium]